MFKGIISDKLEIILKEIQVVLSASYILLIMIGMIFEATHYSRFNINIFNYSGILDFLLVPFRRPFVLIYLISTSVVVFLLFVFDEWLKNKHPKTYKWLSFGFDSKGFYSYFRIFTFILLYFTLLFALGARFSKNFRSRLSTSSPDTRIEYDLQNKNFIEGTMIGKNESYIFLLNSDNKVQIVPLNSTIVKIVPLK